MTQLPSLRAGVCGSTEFALQSMQDFMPTGFRRAILIQYRPTYEHGDSLFVAR